MEELNIPGKTFLDTEIARVRELDPTRLVTIVTVMAGRRTGWKSATSLA